MRTFAIIALSAPVGRAPLGGVTRAQNSAPGRKYEQPAPSRKQVRRQEWKKGCNDDGHGSAVTNHSRHKREAPPDGRRWVRNGSDFIPIATATDIISSIVRAAGN